MALSGAHLVFRLAIRATAIGGLAITLAGGPVHAQEGALWRSASDASTVSPSVVEASDRDDQFAALAQEAEALEKQARLLERVVKLVEPSVVHIEVKKYEQGRFAASVYGPIEETGAGVIIRLDDHERYVLTNLHVVSKATLENIRLRLFDGRQLRPTKMWSEPRTDLAVLAVSAPQLVAARIGDSDQAEIGQFVLAIGSPFGLRNSVTFGIISAKGRRDLELEHRPVEIKDFLQTDAAINPGNSGGPLLNLRGEVVGINTAIASSSGGNDGIGFSIPINMAMSVARQLITQGRVAYPYLGVKLDSTFTAAQAMELGLARLEGARVKGITPGSPAERAQIQPGDVIMQFGGIAVEDDSHLVNLVQFTPVGKELPVVVVRGNQSLTLEVMLSDRGDLQGP
jgi:serine protease Do